MRPASDNWRNYCQIIRLAVSLNTLINTSRNVSAASAPALAASRLKRPAAAIVNGHFECTSAKSNGRAWAAVQRATYLAREHLPLRVMNSTRSRPGAACVSRPRSPSVYSVPRLRLPGPWHVSTWFARA